MQIIPIFDLSVVEAAMGEFGVRLTSAEAAIVNAETDITTLTNQQNQFAMDLNDMGIAVSNHETSINDIAGDVTTLQADLNTAEANISSLQSTVAGHTTSIGTLNANVGTLNTNVSSLQSTVGGHTTSIGTLNTNVSTITGDVSTLQTDVNVAEADIDTLQGEMLLKATDTKYIKLALGSLVHTTNTAFIKTYTGGAPNLSYPVTYPGSRANLFTPASGDYINFCLNALITDRPVKLRVSRIHTSGTRAFFGFAYTPNVGNWSVLDKRMGIGHNASGNWCVYENGTETTLASLGFNFAADLDDVVVTDNRTGTIEFFVNGTRVREFTGTLDWESTPLVGGMYRNISAHVEFYQLEYWYA